MGIVDAFSEKGLPIFGPTRKAAQIEASKVFAKKLMQKYDIPTGRCKIFTDAQKALDYINKQPLPIVVKADGLTGGKGVTVAKTKEEAVQAVERTMVKKDFGPAGDWIIIEEYLEGPEFSMIGFADGKTVLSMEPSQDHKPIYNRDKGPNTGGMGAYSPVPVVEPHIWRDADYYLRKTIEAMTKEGIPYKGVLYGGMILTPSGVKVLEFNCRFGDPETQAVLPRLKTDLVEVVEAVMEERLDQIQLEWSKQQCLCVVMASEGYPDPSKYKTGFPITNLDKFKNRQDLIVFHAGTEKKNGLVVTSSGRVLGVTALGNGYGEAITKAYQAVDSIHFDNKYYRTDIGQRALETP